jgi:hypothetical protein
VTIVKIDSYDSLPSVGKYMVLLYSFFEASRHGAVTTRGMRCWHTIAIQSAIR